MKNLITFEDFLYESWGSLTKEQEEFLDSVVPTGDWHFNKRTGRIDVEGDVNFHFRPSKMEFSHIPVRFGVVSGAFDCSDSNIVSLLGCPVELGKTFDCSDCKKLESMEHLTKHLRFFRARGCPLVPEEERIVFMDSKLFKEFNESDMGIKEFVRVKRGEIKGKKFGI